mgnify:CR=1 FL=1
MSDQQSSKDKLLKLVKPGDTVYTILRHVSRSGMSRVIDLVIISDGQPFSISGWAAEVTNSTLDRDRWGIKITGVGMDMGFALVYELSYALFQDDFSCIGEECPANDHSNGDRDYNPHQHSDAGYALKQRWI